MKRLVLLLVSVGACLVGCGDRGDDSNAADTAARAVIEVGSAQELLDALGPNRTLKLRAGVEYRLDGLERGVAEFYRWEEALTDQYELVIRNCRNLTLEGPALDKALIVTAHAYANVLHFENCSGLTLSNLTIGHAPDPGYCSGGVVAITDSADILIEASTLFGCGTEGLTLRGVRNLTAHRITITECTYGIVSARQCEGLTFRDCRFFDNQEHRGFVLTDTTGVRLTNCILTENTVNRFGQALFKTNLTTPDARIDIVGGRINDNVAPKLARPADMVVLQDVVVLSNSWQGAGD